jgi:hypothetical protein
MARRALLQIDEEKREVFLLGFGELLTYSPNESVCEDLANGRASELQRIRVLVNVPDTHMDIWMQSRQSAAFASLRGAHSPAAVAPPRQELEEALQLVLPPPAAQELISQVNATGTLSSAEACRLAINGGFALYRLNQRDRAELAPLLAQRFSE